MSFLTGKTYRIIIQGCRTNQYEGEAIASALEKAGAVRGAQAADITVVVTCTITSVADSKCRKIIRRARRENEKSVIVVCGCYVQKMADAERRELGIDIAVGNRLKYRIPLLLKEWFDSQGVCPPTELDADITAACSWDKLELDHPRLRTRAFLKIQDGCSHFCSYCIVPFVRGNPVSRDAGEVMEEVSRIAASGCPEIVLTGIHIGLYQGLGELVKRIDATPGIRRIRFGSVEPFAVDDKLLDALASSKAFCPHLHLPLQSGDGGVLEKMRRGYTPREFAAIVERARIKLGGDLHVSTDLMVGFPGEDEKAFGNSLKFAAEMGFGKIHIFPYSPRQGTDAARLPRPAAAEVRERVRLAQTLADELHEKYAARWIGKNVSVLAEESRQGIINGLTPHFVRVLARNPARQGEEACVMPESYTKGVLYAGMSANDKHMAEDSVDFNDFL